MTGINQRGQPVEETVLYGSGMCWTPPTVAERDTVIAMLAERLGVCVVRTNATKHGTTEIVLKEIS